MAAALSDPTRAPGQKLAAALTEALEAEGEARVLAARAPVGAAPMHGVLRPFAALFTADAQGLLDDAARIDGWPASAQGAFAHQVLGLGVRGTVARALAEHGPLPSVEGPAFDPRAPLNEAALRAFDRRAEAYVQVCQRGVQEATERGEKWLARVASRSDAPPESEAGLGPVAEAVLRHTEAPTLGLMRRAISDAQRANDPGQPVSKIRPTVTQLLRALGQGGQAPRLVSKGRPRRLAEALKGLEMRELGQFARVEAGNPGGLSPVPAVFAVRVPHRVILWPQRPAEGALGEVADLYALGRAMALCLVAPAEPIATRHCPDASPVLALGHAFAFLGTTPLFVERTYGRGEGAATDSQLAEVQRHAQLSHLLAIRIAAARFLTAQAPERARIDASVEAVRTALCGLELPAGLCALLADVAGHDALGGGASTLRGAVNGWGLAHALRDRFDEDWFLNPRTEEAVRAFCYRGAGVSAEGLLSDLGVTTEESLAMLRESTANL